MTIRDTFKMTIKETGNMYSQLNDCWVDRKGKAPTLQKLLNLAERLPDEILELAIKWGWDDTQVGDIICTWITKNYPEEELHFSLITDLKSNCIILEDKGMGKKLFKAEGILENARPFRTQISEYIKNEIEQTRVVVFDEYSCGNVYFELGEITRVNTQSKNDLTPLKNNWGIEQGEGKN